MIHHYHHGLFCFSYFFYFIHSYTTMVNEKKNIHQSMDHHHVLIQFFLLFCWCSKSNLNDDDLFLTMDFVCLFVCLQGYIAECRLIIWIFVSFVCLFQRSIWLINFHYMGICFFPPISMFCWCENKKQKSFRIA